MRRLLLFILLLSFSCVAVATPWVHGPYTGGASESSVTISWMTEEACPARVECAVLPRDGGETTFRVVARIPEEESVSGETVHVALERLPSHTEHLYRVVLETEAGDVYSPEGHFWTAPPPGQPVTFVVLSDTQWQWEGENRLRAVGQAIAGDECPFEFILHAGDLVESPAAHYWEHWFSSFDEMLLRAPLLPVLGNHERNHGSYFDQFTLPPGGGRREKQWWVFRWGDVVVVGLDTNVRQATQILAQQEWARTQLSGPQQHKFVVFHHPVFSSDAYHGSGYSYDVIYHPVFVEQGVDIVFTGHAHNYERIVRDGVTYLGVGGGGAVPRALAPDRVDGSVVALEGHNFYLRVHAAPSGIDVETVSVARADDDTFVRTDGHLLDTFSLSEPTSSRSTVARWRLLAVLGILGVVLAGVFLLRGSAR
jgi:predicted phosphodiesterase